MIGTKNLAWTSLVLIASCAFASCGHDNGSAGTTNGTSAESYYFNDPEHLAAPIGSVSDTAKTESPQPNNVESTAADSAK